MPKPVETIYGACQAAGWDQTSDPHEVVTAIIQAIIDRTPSPTTVVELTRILRKGGVEVAEATFD